MPIEKQQKISIFVILLFAFVAIVFTNRGLLEKKPTQEKPQKQIPEGMKRYLNHRYGFGFDYPEEWSLEDKSVYAYLDVDGDGFDISVDMSGFNPEKETVEDRLIEIASRLCAADGLGVSKTCPPEDISVENITSNKGEPEYFINRDLVTRTYSNVTKEFVFQSQKNPAISFLLEIQEPRLITFSVWDPDYFNNLKILSDTFFIIDQKIDN